MPPVTVHQAFALALQRHQAGRLAEAEALYRQVLAVQPQHAEAWRHLGVIACQVGRYPLAVDLIRQALTLAPHNAAAHCNLGEACRSMGRFEEAVIAYQQALQLAPDSPETCLQLGLALGRSGRFDEAIAAYQRALVLRPEYAEACNNLGNALSQQGRLDEAIAAYQRALQIRAYNPEAQANLGVALARQGRFEEALEAHRRALELKPDFPEAHNNLGVALAERGRWDEAIAAYRRALALKPDYAEAYDNLGNALGDEGEQEQAVDAHREAVELMPAHAAFRSNLILAMLLRPDLHDASIREEQARWNHLYAEPLQPARRPHGNDANPSRRLKVGYVSADFRSHAISFFMAPLLEAHDHLDCEIYGYASVRQPDAVTERLRRSADVWRDISALSDVQFAAAVRDDGIDILVDLAMHSAGNRLLAFAHKPAPVQVSWLAYPGSTGLETIDYRITDAQIEPPNADDIAPGGEAVYLPDAWCCYAPIEEFPIVGPLPAASAKTVVFGSLNQFCKIHEGLLRCWAKLLATVPESRLLMICPEGQARERTHALFAAQGIDRERVELVAPCPWREYLRLLERIDLALDAWPCNGMTTACHALWMGVPVITLTGTSALSRATSSPLHAIGLSAWVAGSEAEYIRLATEWATDLPRLGELRRTLRARMASSPLMDAPRFARQIEAAYRTMWQRWCAGRPS